MFGPSGGGSSIPVSFDSGTTATRDAISSPGDGYLFYNTSVHRLQQYDSGTTRWKDVGDPLATNYIKNWNAETNTTNGWATYADAAGTAPVDGTGGSPNVTISTSTSSPLDDLSSFTLVKGGSANRQGQGWSYDFTINSADQAKVLGIQFDYLLASGTFVAGSSNTSTSDVTIWIYDVTNAVIIQPSSIFLASNNTSVTDVFKASFQTASNSTSYRLIFHVSTTSTSDYTLKVDNVIVSRNAYVFGTPVTDWQTYTPTFTGFGTVSTQTSYWRRVGDSLQIRCKFTAGTVTATEARVSFPSGLTAASTITTIECSGEYYRDVSTSAHGGPVLIEPSVAYMTFGYGSVFGNGTGTAGTKQNASTAFANSDVVHIIMQVPIAGWSSSVQTTNDADTRVCAASYYATANQTTSTTQTVNCDTKVYDTHGAVTAAAAGTGTWKFTAPLSGFYRVSGYLDYTSGSPTINIYKNGTIYACVGICTSGSTLSFSYTISLIAGDYIDIRSATSATCTGNASQSNVASTSLTVERISGPSAIAANELVSARYFASGTSISGSLATVSWTTKDWDTHSAMSSGTFTVPISGKYQINAAVATAATYALNNQLIIEIQKNGSVSAREKNYAAAAVTDLSAQISDMLNCVAGDTIRIQLSSAGTGPTIVSSNFENYISIARLGL